MKKQILSLALLLGVSALGFSQEFSAKPAFRHISEGTLSRGVDAVCDTAINYTDGVYQSAIGAGAQTWSAGIYFDTVQTKFYTSDIFVEAIQFYIADTAVINGVNLRIYEGTTISGTALGNTISNGTAVLDTFIANADIVNGGMTMIMTDSIEIDKTLGYSVFVEVIQTASGFPMGVSQGPMVLGRGGWIELGGTVQMIEANSALDYNWMISVCTNGDYFIPPIDAAIAQVLETPTGYEITPLDQLDPDGYDFWVDVENKGANLINSVTVDLSVQGGQMTDSQNWSNIFSGATSTVQLNNTYLPTTEGFHTIDASVTVNDFINIYDSTIIYDTTEVYDTTVNTVLDSNWIDTIQSGSFTVDTLTFDSDSYFETDSIWIQDTLLIVSSDTLTSVDTIALIDYSIYTDITTIDTTQNINAVTVYDTIVQGDFNLTDNVKSGEFFISDSLYSRTSEITFYITGEGLMGNAYDFHNNTAISKVIVSDFLNSMDNPPTSEFPMNVYLFDVDKNSNQVVPFPLAISDTVVIPDSFFVSANQNLRYDLEFNFTTALSVFPGQRILAAFTNPASGVRRFDEPQNYETATCFVGTIAMNPDTTFEYQFSENAGSYYLIDLILDPSRFGEEPPESVEELNSFDVNLYPNPTKDVLSIKSTSLIKSIIIYDNQGKEVLTSSNVNSVFGNISLVNLPNGMYQVVVTNNDGSKAIRKLSKMK